MYGAARDSADGRVSLHLFDKTHRLISIKRPDDTRQPAACLPRGSSPPPPLSDGHAPRLLSFTRAPDPFRRPVNHPPSSYRVFRRPVVGYPPKFPAPAKNSLFAVVLFLSPSNLPYPPGIPRAKAVRTPRETFVAISSRTVVEFSPIVPINQFRYVP